MSKGCNYCKEKNNTNDISGERGKIAGYISGHKLNLVAYDSGSDDEYEETIIIRNCPMCGSDLDEVHGKPMTVCFTGKMSEVRWKLEDLAVKMGQDPVSTVTAKLDLLVLANYKSGSRKASKARNRGTRLLTEEAWREMPYNGSKEEIEEYIQMNMFVGELLYD